MIACAVLGISRVLASWLSALIVGVALLTVVGIAALAGKRDGEEQASRVRPLLSRLPLPGRYARRAGGTAGDTGSGLPDQRLRLRDRYAPGWGCLPAESGTGCPAWLDGRFASKSALHPAGRVLTSSQRS